VKLKPEKNSGLKGPERTHDLCDTGAVLYQEVMGSNPVQA